MKKFLDWYANLAPEGETMLVVHQKPKREGGWYYLAKWPREWAPRQAMYGNIGSYITERFVERPSAQARHIERVAIMLLDDIGTKSKQPPLPPTWRIESSPGNEQWGYVFGVDDQPDKATFTGAITAIARAGFTDPGATNPVRNFRLPGSLNLKPGANGFAAKLIDWHPEREFTLPQILEALGVEADAPVSMPDPVTLADDGNDRIVKWLAERHLILSPPNSAGWMGVQCPNCDAHSDGNLEGRYSPATRAYKCMHGHCTEWDSEAYLKWVQAQGGPVATPGLRDELLAEALAPALAQIQPTEAFPDRVVEAVAEVERREAWRVEKAEWPRRFAYVEADDGYFDLQERQEIPRATFNALFRHVLCHSVHASSNGARRRVEAATCFDESRVAAGAASVRGVTFAPGEGPLVALYGNRLANKWRDARITPVPGDVTPWLQHAERMLPDPDERNHVFDAMAHKLQHPGIKINHAILHAGIPGSGKDTLWAPFFYAIGGPSQTNVALTRAENLLSQWGYALESEVVVLNELRQTEAADRRHLENHLKPLIAAPPEFLSVNRKGKAPYDALNRLFVVAFSNERGAIALADDDRRWYVLWSDAERMPEANAKALWTWYKSGGFAHVAAWLMARDVSMFNPGAAPPVTDAKRALMTASRTSAEAHIVELVERRQGEFARGVVASSWQLLADRLQPLVPPGVRLNGHAVLYALKAAGWLDLGMVKSGDYQTKKHIFAVKEMTRLHTKSELRRLVEQPPGVPFQVIPGGKG